MFTLEEDCKALCEALMYTKQIQWNKGVLFYALHKDLYPKVSKALEKTTFKVFDTSVCDAWWVLKEKAVKFDVECPPEVFIAKLDKSHASIINPHWPPRYKDSDKYLAMLIEMNGGYGVFLKSDGTLVAWGIRNLLGLGALQTVEEYKRKGYGSLITRFLSKEIAKKGADPVGTVNEHNPNSQNMFKKLGFEIIEQVVYIESEEHRS